MVEIEKRARLRDLQLGLANAAILYGVGATLMSGLLGAALNRERQAANATTAQLTPAEQREARDRRAADGRLQDPQSRQVKRAKARAAAKAR